MKKYWWLLVCLLFIYSSGIVVISFVKPLWIEPIFDEIRGPFVFFAINTSLTMFFLWASALLFIVNTFAESILENRTRIIVFYIIQAAILFYLGLDERFMFHERAGDATGLDDVIFLLGIVIVELMLLIFYFKIFSQEFRKWRILVWAGILIGITLITDIKYFHTDKFSLLLMLIEELAEVWASFLLMLWPVEIILRRVKEAKEYQA